MTRRTWSAVLALSLAGGVYLAATTARASNMGFKLERDFDVKRTSAPGNAPLRNVYWVSVPLFNGLGDVADGLAIDPATTRPFKNKCVGDPTGPPGPGGDGRIDAFDAACDWWTDRNNPSGGAFSLSYYDSDNCSIGAIAASRRFNQPDFGASVPFPASGDLRTDIGYQINVQAQVGQGDPRNRAVIVGSHDPAFTGHTIHFSTACGTSAPRADLVAVPYHAMYQWSVELLCGLKGVAWADADNNNRPDDPPPPGFGVCNGGIFDDQVGAQHSIQVSTVKNDDPVGGGVSGLVPQAARRNAFGFSLLPPDPFALIPGEAYLVAIGSQHVDTVLRVPHF